LPTAEQRYKLAEDKYGRARQSVFAKLQLLDTNKLSVMRKQLKLFNSAICTVRVFRHKFTLVDAIGSHACSLQALACV
jgi:hypothetical protein